MVSWLLYYGSRVRVEAPSWLRDRVLEEHMAGAERQWGQVSTRGRG
jgi:hypothetical protein